MHKSIHGLQQDDERSWSRLKREVRWAGAAQHSVLGNPSTPPFNQDLTRRRACHKHSQFLYLDASIM